MCIKIFIYLYIIVILQVFESYFYTLLPDVAIYSIHSQHCLIPTITIAIVFPFKSKQ